MRAKRAYLRGKLKRSFCAFIDILGFKELTKKAAAAGTEPGLLKSLIDALKGSETYQDRTDTNNRYLWDYKFFTDHLVIGYPYVYAPSWVDSASDGESELLLLMHLCAGHQLALALRGFIVRGAIASGSLHIGKEIAFGDSLVRAYELESDCKTYRAPRIILDPDLIPSLLDRHINSSKPLKNGETGIPHSAQNQLLIVDEADNKLFVNYLDFLGELNGPIQTLRRHRDFIQDKLATESGRVLDKYRWLAEYHNFFCDNFRIYSQLTDEYLDPQAEKIGLIGNSTKRFRRLHTDKERIDAYKKLSWKNYEKRPSK